MCTALRTVGHYPQYNQNLFGEYDEDIAPNEDNDPDSNEVEPIDRLTLAEEEAETTLKYGGLGALWGGIIGGVGGCLSGAAAGAVATPVGMIMGCLAGAWSGGTLWSQVGGAVGAATGITRAAVEQYNFDPKNPEESYVKAKRWGNISDKAIEAVGTVYGGVKASQAIPRFNKPRGTQLSVADFDVDNFKPTRRSSNANISIRTTGKHETLFDAGDQIGELWSPVRESRASLVRGKRPIYNTNASTSKLVPITRGPKPPPINTKGLTLHQPSKYTTELGQQLPKPKHIKTPIKAKVAKPLKNVKWDPVRNNYVRIKK